MYKLPQKMNEGEEGGNKKRRRSRPLLPRGITRSATYTKAVYSYPYICQNKSLPPPPSQKKKNERDVPKIKLPFHNIAKALKAFVHLIIHPESALENYPAGIYALGQCT